MKKSKTNYQRFYVGMILPIAFFLSYFILSAQILTRAGEYSTMTEIVKTIKDTNGIYGPALYETTFWYKKEIYQQYPPNIAALGSSRVLQFRADRFKDPFINLGSMRSLDEVIEILKDLFTDAPPEILLLGIDFWWFRPQAEDEKFNRSPEHPRIRLIDLFEPLRWLARDKLQLRDIGAILSATTPHLGIAGISRQDGFDVHGSYHYTSTFTGRVPNYDWKFLNTLTRIENGDRVFGHSAKISEKQWKKLEDLLADLAKRKIKVILFMPPLAPIAVDAIKAAPSSYGYVTHVRDRLPRLAAKYNMPYADFHDLRPQGSHDCEFLDGVHGGEIAYDRILLALSNEKTPLAEKLDLSRITKSIETHKGRVTDSPEEADFLGIGCKK